MVKNDTIIKKIENFEEHRNELMKKIIEEKFDWTIDEENNYWNSKTGEIINSNNFASEQNEQIKNEIISLQLFKERGRAGKIKGLISRVENETSYENRIEVPIKKS